MAVDLCSLLNASSFDRSTFSVRSLTPHYKHTSRQKVNPDLRRNNPMLPRIPVNLDLHMSFGEYLKEKMREKSVRAADLARRTGITKQGIGRLLNNVPHPISGAEPKPELETVEKIAKALDLNIDEARLAAGFAPTNTTPPKPRTLAELLSRLEELGVSHIEFFDPSQYADASPEALQDALDAVTIAISLTLNKRPPRLQDDPTNANSHR